ncbi:MAG: YaaL family protein, partial [Thermacetogeniaceae bacterium]
NLLRSLYGQGSGSGALPSEEALLAEAHREWLAAREFFDNATDPDLIDYAILSLKAAEKRYVYLWKKARERHGRGEG